MFAPRHALALVALLVAVHPAPAAAERCACEAGSEAPLMSEADAEAMMSALFSSDARLASEGTFFEPAEEPSVLLAAHHAASLPLADLASFMPSLVDVAAAPSDASPGERPAWCERADDPRCRTALPLGAAGELSPGPLAPPPPAPRAAPPRPSALVAHTGPLLGAASGQQARIDRPPRG